jgi:hypothetical protein
MFVVCTNPLPLGCRKASEAIIKTKGVLLTLEAAAAPRL